jgi:carbon monoxide dehydrogenase subunit G
VQLTHRFTVPGSVEETWQRFGDIAQVAQCFPGAQVTSAEGDEFEGTVKVKLGPIALVYAGSGRFVSKDAEARSLVVEAKGRDKRGNGTAGATITVQLAGRDGTGASGETGTDVQVDTDLAITGKPAQFGRGVLQDVSDKLLGQFVACLEQRSSVPAGAHAAEAGAAAAAPADTDAGPASAPSGAAAVAGPEGGDPDAGPASAPAAAAAQGSPAATATPVTAASNASSNSNSSSHANDATDLGATLLPALARGYWRYAAGVALGGAVVVIAVRGMRRR